MPVTSSVRPLTLLSTRAQLLARRLHRDPRVTDQVVSDVDGVVADTRTLTEILDDLLTAADTRSQAEWTAVDLAALVEEVAGAAAASAERSEVTLTVSKPASNEASARVEGSTASLRRALTALVDNAVSHATSAVTLTVRTSGRRVEVEVSDDGPGIPQDIAPRLFDRFSSLRAETQTLPTPDGRRHYGLGLALVADVAANHQGRVAVTARSDGQAGAVFTLVLPRQNLP